MELFACWTAQFDVSLVPFQPPQSGLFLRFVPQQAEGQAVLVDLFERWFTTTRGGRPVFTALNHLIQLANMDGRFEGPAAQERILAAAQYLGPLVTALPSQSAMAAVTVEEPLSTWIDLAQRLKALSDAVGKLPRTGRDDSRHARTRRAELMALMDLGFPHLESLSAAERRETIASYRPSEGISALDEQLGDIGILADALWHYPISRNPGINPLLTVPRPRLEETIWTFQLNIPCGIQALLVMALYDRSLDGAVKVKTCARAGCHVMAFMSARRRYCSEQCQRAAAEQRRRKRVARRKKPSRRKRPTA